MLPSPGKELPNTVTVFMALCSPRGLSIGRDSILGDMSLCASLRSGPRGLPHFGGSLDQRSQTRAVHVGGRFQHSTRLCRPAVRKASGFPAHPCSLLTLRAGWKAQPSSRRGGSRSVRLRHGKAKPFRTAGGGAAVTACRIDHKADKPGHRPPLLSAVMLFCMKHEGPVAGRLPPPRKPPVNLQGNRVERG